MKYPVYIVSKGRYENPITAKYFLNDGVDFKIAVEPQEYELYCKSVGARNVLKLPFSNLGKGSYPARNFCWNHSIELGAKRHWVFDDNIRGTRRLYKGKRIPCSTKIAIDCLEQFTDRYTNIGISAFNYKMFTPNTTKKPFYLNVHAYSAMLIKNDMPFRWRLKYNEDVDLCLQVLHSGLCTILLNAFMVDKCSTTAKMKGGNQTELYQGNKYEKKVQKAKTLEAVWPKYVETVIRFKRPHHFVDWKKHFKQPLIRNDEIDWSKIEKTKHNIELKVVKEIKSKSLSKWHEENKQQ